MACPVIVDLRNIYRPEDMKKQGFAYTCIGRAPTFQPVNVYVPGRGPFLSRSNAVAISAMRGDGDLGQGVKGTNGPIRLEDRRG